MKRAGTVLIAAVLVAGCGKSANHQMAEHQNGGAMPAAVNLPALAPPNGMIVLRQAGTGRVFGVRFPGPPSATQLMQFFIQGLNGYFDQPPQFDHPARDARDARTQIAFTATLHGMPVRGLLNMTAMPGGGEGHMMIDYADRLATSYRYLLAPGAAGAAGAAGGAAAAAAAGAYGGNGYPGGNGGAYPGQANNTYTGNGGGGAYPGANAYPGYPAGGGYPAANAYPGAAPSDNSEPSGYAPGGAEAARVDQNVNDSFDEYIRGTTMLEHQEGGETVREEVDQNYGHDMATQLPDQYREVPMDELNPAPAQGDGGGYGGGYSAPSDGNGGYGGGYSAPADTGGGYAAPADTGGSYAAPEPAPAPAPEPTPDPQ